MTVHCRETNKETDLRNRIATILQLKKDFQSPDDASGTVTQTDQPAARDLVAPLRLPQPDPTLVGKEQAHQWLLPCVFTALFLIGVLTAARGWQQVERAAETAAWPYTRGVIVTSEVEAYSSSEGVRWRPLVTYLYRVGKREVLGTQIRLVEPVSAFDESEARTYAERYRLHGEVLVYYNPERINESVLDQSAPPSAYLTINLGLALATASAALLVVCLRIAGNGACMPRASELPQSS
jgi:hypothetical protein